MYCNTLEECFKELNMYFAGEPIGYPFIVNVNNYNDFYSLRQRFETDTSVQCVYVSQFLKEDDLPKVTDATEKIRSKGTFALIGVSQALMLYNKVALERSVERLLKLSVSGHAVVLLEHCENIISPYLFKDKRLDRNVILVRGLTSKPPKFKIAFDTDIAVGHKPFKNIKELLVYLEQLDDSKIADNETISFLTKYKASFFKDALYSVEDNRGAFEIVAQVYPELQNVNQDCGTELQWQWLLSLVKEDKSFSVLVQQTFGSISDLSSHVADILKDSNENIKWLLWLALKIYGTGTNKYLEQIFNHENSFNSFEKDIYDELLNISCSDARFETYYIERRKLIEKNIKNEFIDSFCNTVGKFGKNAVLYLTSLSEREEYELVKCFSMYEYTKEEINAILKRGFPEVYSYMQSFDFNEYNTKLPASAEALRGALTQYFNQYKLQKLTNHIFPDFQDMVDTYAQSRPFMSLQSRSSLVAKINREKAGIFFFDALGVEYLAYILSKCKDYGMLADIMIGRCELPSITFFNKEFEKYGDINKISDLDELKHHSIEYDYTKCPYPIHLFKELEIIDKELRQIQSKLSRDEISKAIIVSDHGASRLAVLYGKEVSTEIELEEKGKHSGRCCPVDKDPKLPQASYAEGFAVLANYERFKGGRSANLEVHGGASMEEVVVPIIVLTKKPTDVKYYFVENVIQYKMGQPIIITLFCSNSMKQPRIEVNGKSYDGKLTVDDKHAEFELDIKRSGKYTAHIYEGACDTYECLDFTVERKTKATDLF